MTLSFHFTQNSAQKPNVFKSRTRAVVVQHFRLGAYAVGAHEVATGDEGELAIERAVALSEGT